MENLPNSYGYDAFYVNMEEPTVESIFGINAGTVLEALNENGTCTVPSCEEHGIEP
jgi:hypothetical protein